MDQKPQDCEMLMLRGKSPLSFRLCLAGAGCADHLCLHLLGLITHPELTQRPLVPVQLPDHEAVELLLHLLQALVKVKFS